MNYCQIRHVVGKVSQDSEFGLLSLVWDYTERGGFKPFRERATEAVFWNISDDKPSEFVGEEEIYWKRKYTEIILTMAKYSFKEMLCLSMFLVIC